MTLKGSIVLRLFFSALAVLILASGCSGVRTIQVDIPEENDGEWVSEAQMRSQNANASNPSRMYTRKKEAKYIIKPEPYSVKSKKKDPELLGPQRTYHAGTTTTQAPTASQTTHRKSTMTKASCISMIGQAKYNSYVKKYGGDKGALRRCLILKRLRG